MIKNSPCGRVRLFPHAPSSAEQENMVSMKNVMSLIPRVTPPGFAFPQTSSAQSLKIIPKDQFRKALIILTIFVTLS